jgi:hypothetical protein
MSVIEASEHNRPRASEPEVALFNDAFVAVLIGLAARNYSQRSGGKPMPWLLAFIVVPLVVAEPTRKRLPKSTAARFATWIAYQPLLHAEFPDRAVALTPRVRSALRYGLRSGALFIDRDGIRSTLGARRFDALRTHEAVEAGRQAAFLGRWFAVVEDVPSIFRQLGVTP